MKNCVKPQTNPISQNQVTPNLIGNNAKAQFFLTGKAFSFGSEDKSPDMHHCTIVVRFFNDKNIERLVELSASCLEEIRYMKIYETKDNKYIMFTTIMSFKRRFKGVSECNIKTLKV